MIEESTGETVPTEPEAAPAPKPRPEPAEPGYARRSGAPTSPPTGGGVDAEESATSDQIPTMRVARRRGSRRRDRSRHQS